MVATLATYSRFQPGWNLGGGGTVREEDGGSSVDVVGGDAEGGERGVGEGVKGDKHGEDDEVDDGGDSSEGGKVSEDSPPSPQNYWT
jgi:hypothetical protein